MTSSAEGLGRRWGWDGEGASQELSKNPGHALHLWAGFSNKAVCCWDFAGAAGKGHESKFEWAVFAGIAG